jgi:hypothetical protein
MHLSRRDHVVMTLDDGRQVKGDFVHADDTSIRVGSGYHPILREQVRQVTVVNDTRKRNRITGFLLGAALGIVADRLHCGSGPSCSEGAALYFWPGAGLGLLIGAAVPGKVTSVTIYPGS